MTKNIQAGTIVVAVDGSDDSERAIHWAAEQARLERRPLTVVTATGVPTVPTAAWSSYAPGYTLQPDELLEGAQAVADGALEIAEKLLPGAESHAVALLGDARQVLVDASKEAHLLVLGSRGHGPLRSKLLGSVSAAVSRDSLCPTVVCRPPRKHEDSGKGVLVGADGTAESLPVIEFAFQQASLRGLPLTVLHAAWDEIGAFHGPGLTQPTDHAYEQQRLLLAESVAGFASTYPEVVVDLLPARGLAEDCLGSASARWDLIVVGRHPVDTVLRLLTGAVATAVVEHAHTNVAVVPQAEPADGS